MTSTQKSQNKRAKKQIIQLKQDQQPPKQKIGKRHKTKAQQKQRNQQELLRTNNKRPLERKLTTWKYQKRPECPAQCQKHKFILRKLTNINQQGSTQNATQNRTSLNLELNFCSRPQSNINNLPVLIDRDYLTHYHQLPLFLQQDQHNQASLSQLYEKNDNHFKVFETYERKRNKIERTKKQKRIRKIIKKWKAKKFMFMKKRPMMLFKKHRKIINHYKIKNILDQPLQKIKPIPSHVKVCHHCMSINNTRLYVQKQIVSPTEYSMHVQLQSHKKRWNQKNQQNINQDECIQFQQLKNFKNLQRAFMEKIIRITDIFSILQQKERIFRKYKVFKIKNKQNQQIKKIIPIKLNKMRRIFQNIYLNKLFKFKKHWYEQVQRMWHQYQRRFG